MLRREAAALGDPLVPIGATSCPASRTFSFCVEHQARSCSPDAPLWVVLCITGEAWSFSGEIPWTKVSYLASARFRLLSNVWAETTTLTDYWISMLQRVAVRLR